MRVGERVWSRNEETGEEGYRPVVQTFVTPNQPTLELEFVGGSGATERIEVTVEHPFWVVDRGWVAARDLRPGDEVYTSHGGWVRVSSGTWTERTTTVYNFEVEEFHTYFVGEAGLWVHNNSSFRAQAAANLRRMGLGDVDLAGRSFNSGRKLLGRGGFEWAETTATGRQVFRNPRTGAEVHFDSGNALAPGQKPHWHVRDAAGNRYDRLGRPVGSDEGAGHIPAY